MKDEIKEILEDKKQYLEYWESENIWSQQKEYDRKILDYITNLQEENERYKIAYENVMIANKMLDEKYKDYKIRNEKAISCINYYATENDDYSKLYSIEEEELLKILQGSDE